MSVAIGAVYFEGAAVRKAFELAVATGAPAIIDDVAVTGILIGALLDRAVAAEVIQQMLAITNDPEALTAARQAAERIAKGVRYDLRQTS
jgi:hypothetical protein